MGVPPTVILVYYNNVICTNFKRRSNIMGNTVKLTPAEISAKWEKRAIAAVPDAIDGVNRVTDSPMDKAAAAQDKMLAGVTAAVQSGKWANSLKAVPLDQWKKVTAEKMTQRMAGGITAAAPKRKKFDEYLVQTLNDILPTINAMPTMTLEDSINKMTAQVRAMAKRPYKK